MNKRRIRWPHQRYKRKPYHFHCSSSTASAPHKVLVSNRISVPAREQRRKNREEVKEKKRQEELAAFWESCSREWRREREALERAIKPEVWVPNPTTDPSKPDHYQSVSRTVLYQLFVGYFITKEELDLTAIRAKENRRRFTRAGLAGFNKRNGIYTTLRGRKN